MNSHKSSRGNWKRFKNCPYFCQTRVFRDWSESPPSRQVKPPKHSKTEFWKKFSKCFSQLEGLPATKSRAKPQKSLSTPRDWTFHSRTSCQKWFAKTWLRLATWLTRDWVVKTGQKWIFKIFRFLKQNTFQKHLKHSKIFLYLNQQRLSMWKHISSSTITQMNMAFIEHRLVCCVWISTMR